MENNMPNNLTLSGGFFVILFIIFLVVATVCVNMIFPFLRERRYILAEISRTSGHEQRRWKQRLRRLYIKNIPLIGWILVRFMKKKGHRH